MKKEKSRELPEAERRIFCDGPCEADWPQAGHSASAFRGWANLLLHQETPNFVALLLLDRLLTFLERKSRKKEEKDEKKLNAPEGKSGRLLNYDTSNKERLYL